MVGLGSLIQLCHVCEGRRFFVAGGGNFIVTGSKGICAELKRQNADLKKKLQLAQQEIEHLQTTQVRLGEINNNYLMLHYLNKNMHNCRHTQKLWEVYISNVTGKGFDYNRAFVLLKNERGEFSYRLEMQAGVLFTDKNEDGQQIEPFIAQALQSKETFSSSDNTAAAVPIINNCEDVIGVLVVSKEYGITFEDLELLDVYVQQTVSTIENVMLNEKMVQYLDLLGQRLDNFVLLHYASKALHDTTQYHEVLQEYLQISVSAMGFDFTASTMYIVTGERWERR